MPSAGGLTAHNGVRTSCCFCCATGVEFAGTSSTRIADNRLVLLRRNGQGSVREIFLDVRNFLESVHMAMANSAQVSCHNATYDSTEYPCTIADQSQEADKRCPTRT
jgi:hypothetical protein